MMIGQLKKRLVLEEAVATPDGGGGYTRDWQEIATVSAHIETVSARMDTRFDGKKPVAMHKITIPFRPDMKSAMRLRQEETVYQITDLRDPDGNGRWLEIMAAAAGL